MQQSFMRTLMAKKMWKTIEGMQPTLYHVNHERDEIGDIDLNSAFVL